MPMADIRDIGGLLGRAGLALPVADSDRLTVNYPNMFRLMKDLRGMGEQNVLYARLRHPTKRAVFLRAAEIYQDKFGQANGSIPATFDIITLLDSRYLCAAVFLYIIHIKSFCLFNA